MNFKNLITIFMIGISCNCRISDGSKKKAAIKVADGQQNKLPNFSTFSSYYYNPKKNRNNYSRPVIEYTDLEPNKDFTTPLNNNNTKVSYPISIFDFIVREIFANAYRNPVIDKYYVYIDMYYITQYLYGEKDLEESSMICKGALKERILIMPIYIENKPTIVLIANTELRVLVYYNPLDPEGKSKESKKLTVKFIDNLGALISQRNSYALPRERIYCFKEWTVVAGRKKHLPPKIKSIENIQDFGIHAIQFIDNVLNDKLTFQCKRGNISDYRTEIRNYLFRLIWNNTFSVSNNESKWIVNHPKSLNPAPPGQIPFPGYNYEDCINENKDFTAPFDKDPPKREMVCLLDYCVEKMITESKKRKTQFLYLPMHLITPYLFDKKLERNSQIYSYSFENRVLIMPIYRPTKHTIVLVAYVRKKIVEYYNPIDPNLKSSESKMEVEKIFKRFMELLRKWYNVKVSSDKEKIILLCKDWKLIKTTKKVPVIPNEDAIIFDFGIHAIQFIDYIIGHGELSIQYEGGINEYYTKLRDSIIQKMRIDYDNRMNKQIESLLVN